VERIHALRKQQPDLGKASRENTQTRRDIPLPWSDTQVEPSCRSLVAVESPDVSCSVSLRDKRWGAPDRVPGLGRECHHVRLMVVRR